MIIFEKSNVVWLTTEFTTWLKDKKTKLTGTINNELPASLNLDKIRVA